MERVVTDHLQRRNARGRFLARKVLLDQEVQSLVLGIQKNERVVFERVSGHFVGGVLHLRGVVGEKS